MMMITLSTLTQLFVKDKIMNYHHLEKSDDIFLDALKLKIIPPSDKNTKIFNFNKNKLNVIKVKKNKSKKQKSNLDFFKSCDWLKLRYKALKIHGAMCQCCGFSRKDGIKLHVDHIKPRSKFPELALDISNLQILCEQCNIGKSNTDFTDWR